MVTRHKKNAGNTFLALFAVAALIGILGASLMTFIKGPLKSSISITRQDAAETQMNVAAQSAVTAALSGPGGGDCDADGVIEPLEFRDGAGSPVPTGGGLLPQSIGINKKDPWGTEYGYCVWDHGSTNLQAGCQVTAGVNRRLAGTNSGDYPVIALISAGPDKKFTTTCRSFAAADVVANGVLTDATDLPLISKASESDDDIILSQTYLESSNSTGGLWSLKAADTKIATIGKNLEVTGDGRFSGIGTFQKLTATAGDFLEFISGMKLAGPSVIATCNAGNKGVIRTNMAGDGWEICDGVSTWNAIAGDVEEALIEWPLRAPDGIALMPKYNFAGVMNTGMWYEAPALRFSSNGLMNISGTSISFTGTGSNFRVTSSGGAKFGNDTGACVAALSGTIRYNATSKDYEFCNGSVWANFPADAIAGSSHTPPPPSGKALVFATNATFDGNLGGLVGADDKCQVEASAAGLPGLYKAWLSDSTESPSTRFNQLNLQYQKVDGVVVANNWADLIDGTIASPINKTATNTAASGDAWTNTNTPGTSVSASNNCGNWSNTSGNATLGGTTATNASWTSKGAASCTALRRLYCVQQVGNEDGGGWMGNCNDYASTKGLENAAALPDITKTVYLTGRGGVPMMQYATIGQGPFAGGRTIITGCVTGTGNPGLSNTQTNSAKTSLPITASSSPSIYVDYPETGSVTGKVTFGTAVDVNYTFTHADPGSVLFKTSAVYMGGQVGSLAAADAKCQAAADASPILQDWTWKAILSDSTTDASSRVTVAYPVIDTSNNIMASSNLFSNGMWTSGVRYNEFGQDSGNTDVWTGSTNTGTRGAHNCNNWTNSTTSVSGNYGLPYAYQYWLSWAANIHCMRQNSLYCLSQGPRPVLTERKVFITSLRYEGNMGGLAGADAKCQARATAAGLPGTYMAWISDATGSPSTRFIKSSVPYKLTNGTTIANNWADLTDSSILAAIDKNEFGVSNSSSWGPYTNTNPNGTVETSDRSCLNWTSNSSANAGTQGSDTSTSQFWSTYGGMGYACNSTLPLFCFQQKATTPPALPATEKKVFVTSSSYTTNLGGLSGADAKCQASASAAGVAGTYKAWLSDNTGSPATRFAQSTVPYKLLNGTVIANNWTDLVDGTISNPINRTEANAVTSSSWAFSNTTASGTLRDSTWGCSNWTSTDTGLYGANLGQTGVTTSAWTTGGTDSCGGASVRPLYCFEQ